MKVKKIEINTGGPLIVLMNSIDAQGRDFHTGDRIKLIKGKRELTAILDVAGGNLIRRGYLGVVKEVSSKMKLKNNNEVKVSPDSKPESLRFIKKKLDGKELSKEEIKKIIEDISNQKLSEVEITYFVAACYSEKLSLRETAYLTEAMVNTGDVLKLDEKIVADKHCIGGVAGNRTTMIIVPIVSSLGILIPKTSSRAITSPAGTADTMEVLCKVDFPINELKELLKKTNAFMSWGGAVNLAPADDKIIKVENPLSIDSEGQLLASILAKKKSVSSNHVLIDIPVGRGAKIENLRDARRLKKKFEVLGKKLGMKIRVIITDGSQPIGRGIGPALEARDVLWILERDPRAPIDLKSKGVFMAAHLINMTKGVRFKEALNIANEQLESGRALEKMIAIIKNQKGKITKSSMIKIGRFKRVIKANKSGRINWINNKRISLISRTAGSPLDKRAGIYLEKKKGNFVNHHDIIYTIYAENKEKLDYAIKLAEEDTGYEII